MEIDCPNCNFRIKVNLSKKIRLERQTTIIEFVVSDGNQPHTKKIFLNQSSKIRLYTKFINFLNQHADIMAENFREFHIR
jgi:hypothetical protein